MHKIFQNFKISILLYFSFILRKINCMCDIKAHFCILLFSRKKNFHFHLLRASYSFIESVSDNIAQYSSNIAHQYTLSHYVSLSVDRKGKRVMGIWCRLGLKSFQNFLGKFKVWKFLLNLCNDFSKTFELD